MTLLFFDGFDDYDSGSDLTNNGGWEDQGSTTIVSGRNDGNCLRLTASVASTYCYYRHPSSLEDDTIIVGFAFKTNTTTNDFKIIIFKNESSQLQSELRFDSLSKTLELTRNGTLLASGSTVLLANSWYYIEIKYHCDDVFGSVEVRINETTEISYSGDTQAQSTAAWNRIIFIDANYTDTYYIDDLYILDTNGTTNNTFLGDIQCKIIRPSADYSVQFTVVNAVNNYQAVDDLIGAPNDATDYVYSNTVGHVDQYSLTNMPAADAVYAVKVNTRAQKDDVNPRFFKQGIKTGINTNESSDYNLGTSYANYIDIFEHQGDVSETAWTESAVNAARSTIEVSA